MELGNSRLIPLKLGAKIQALSLKLSWTFRHSKENINKTRKPNTFPVAPSSLQYLVFPSPSLLSLLLPLLSSLSVTLSILKAFDITRTYVRTLVTLKLFSELQSLEACPTVSFGWKCQTERTTPFARFLTDPPQLLASPASVLI